MISLSQAILAGIDRAPRCCATGYFAGDSADVLGTAYLGQLHPGALVGFQARVRASSNEAIRDLMLRELHRVWPDLGRSVRTWPKFVEELERDRLIPRLRANQSAYRQAIHVSLWKVLTDLQAAGELREAIAARLAGHGL